MSIGRISRFASMATLLVALAVAADVRAEPEIAPAPRRKAIPAKLPEGAIARIGRPRMRMAGPAINVVFAPSGTRFIATGTAPAGSKVQERMLLMWDAETGEELFTLRGQPIGVNAAAFSTDGKLLVSGGVDGSVRLWDLTTREELKRFTGHTAPVMAVAYSPDQQLIASAGHDAIIRVWDAGKAEGELLRVPSLKSQGTSNLRFSPDGKALTVIAADFTIRLLNPRTGEQLKKLTGSRNDPQSLDFTRDGRRLASVDEDGEVSIWDVEKPAERKSFQAHPKAGACLRFSPDGTRIATGGQDGSIRFWDADSHKLVHAAAGHSGVVSEIAYSADGSILASAGHEGTVRLWNAAAGAELPQSGGQCRLAALSPDGSQLATAGSGSQVAFWDTATGQLRTDALAASAPARTISYSPDGKNLILGTASNAIDQMSISKAAPVRERIKVGVPFARLASGTKGRLAVATGNGVGRIWNLESGKLADGSDRFAAMLTRLNGIWSMALSPSESHVAIGGADGRLHVWDATESAELFAIPFGKPPVITTAVAWSREGRSIAAASADLSLRVWELGSGQERRLPLTAPFICWSLALAPDGQLLAAGDASGSVRLWHVPTGKTLATRQGHAGPVTYLAFSADGRTLASAGVEVAMPNAKGPDTTLVGDGTAIIWDVAALAPAMPGAPRITEDEAAGLWETLAGDDAVKAADAVWKLAAHTDLSLPLIRERLPKVRSVESDRIPPLIIALDDDDFGTREKATQELIRLGPVALQLLRKELASTKSREVRRRIEQALAKIGTSVLIRPEETLVGRGVEVLLRIDTEESRKLLEAWLKAPPSTLIARELRSVGKQAP